MKKEDSKPLNTIQVSTVSEKMILLLLYIWEKPIRAGTLFQILNEEYNFNRSRQTIHSSIKKLRNKNLLKWKPHKLVELTDEGKEHALHFTWHMHLLERYFSETLDLSTEDVKKEVIMLTPVVSCDFINSIVHKYHQDDCDLKKAVQIDNICFKSETQKEGENRY